MTHPTLPLPGDKVHEGTVIASVFIDDEAATVSALLMLLYPDEPVKYMVKEVWWTGARWRTWTGTLRRFPNIVPAVEWYQDSGGDY